MKAADPDLFDDAAVGFALRKPATWVFVHPTWSRVEQLRREADPEHWVHHAKQPFCAAMQRHESPRHAYPTLQVSSRQARAYGRQAARGALDGAVALMGHQHGDVELLESTVDGVVGGCRASILRCRFTLHLEAEGEVLEMPVIARTHTLYGARHVFTVGISTADDPAFFSEEECAGIVASIRVGGTR